MMIMALLASPAAAEFSGTLSVIDGDTVMVGDARVRLHGIDAPELGQPCINASGDEMDCGSWARDRVAERFEGVTVTCHLYDQDRFGRRVAACIADGEDISAWIVREGLAWAYLAYADTYKLEEKSAAVARRGIWGFQIDDPSKFRRAALPQPPVNTG